MVSQSSAWTRMASRRLLPDSSVPIWQRLRALTRGRQTDCQLPPHTESTAARQFGRAGAILGPLVRAGLGTQKRTLGVHWARTPHLAPGQLQGGIHHHRRSLTHCARGPAKRHTQGTRSSMFCCTYCQRANECSTDRLRRTTEQAALEESGQARWSRDSVAPTLHSKMDEGTRSDHVLY